MNIQIANGVFAEIIATLDIPDFAYEKVEKRYKDLGEWVSRPGAKCSKFSPHVYPQGSFRLGTVVRPLNERDEYDLDLGCRLRLGVTKISHTQKQLKTMVGDDLEDYRKARGIESTLEEKHRCWRLQYADEMSFHMDAVPSIPEVEGRRSQLVEGMIKEGAAKELAEDVTRHAGAITDNTDPKYSVISFDWRISNSEGYAIWFESRIRLAMAFLEKRAFEAKAARVDDLPARKWKSPLQQAIQLLKRHRDVMFAKNQDGKPISIIITTLSGRAYQGEQEIVPALERILNDMDRYISHATPRVANPVNTSEDFADKWSKAEYKNLNLETNFRNWLRQVREDFQLIKNSNDPDSIAKFIKLKFGLEINIENIRGKFGSSPSGGLLKPAAIPAALSFPSKPLIPSKPAGFASY